MRIMNFLHTSHLYTSLVGMRRNRTPLFIENTHGCWLWNRRLTHDGYGQWRHSGDRYIAAHRWIWWLVMGDIPDVGYELDHICRVRRCVNPDHLRVVTRHENMRRATNTKLDPEKVVEIRKMKAAGAINREVAEKFGISIATVRKVYNKSHAGRRGSWSDIPYPNDS